MKKFRAPAANAAIGSGACLTIKLPKFSLFYLGDELPAETKRYIKTKARQTAIRYKLSKSDEEDLTQEIYRSVYNRAQDFDEARNAALTTFLHLCVDGAVREYIRSCKRLKNQKLVFILDVPVSRTENDAEDAEGTLVDHLPNEEAEREFHRIDLKHDVATVLAGLTPEQRTVCELFMNGLTVAEVAKVIGRPRQNIYSLILPKLRKAFAEIF